MTRAIFSPAAIDDLDGIWNYSAETWGIAQADRYTDDIRDACAALAAGTRMGRPVDIRAGYRKYAAGRHYVYFVETGEGITVMRILHQSMDAQRHL